MAGAIFDTHAFIKRLTDAGMPEPQAEILAEEYARIPGEKLAITDDLALLRADLMAMQQRIIDQLTIRLGLVMAGAIAIVAALVTLL
jgi:hypothetical protein